MRVRSVAATLVLGLLLVARSAPAQTNDPEKLFQEGSALADLQRYAEALEKFEAAQRLDPGIGTQFNIAVCYEKLGKLGSAARNFEAVRELARASGKKQREESARARLDALAPRLSGYVIRSEEPGDVLVKVDGVIVPRAGWTFHAVDPGSHRIDATAATKKSWFANFEAPPPGKRVDVVIPKLEVVEGETKLVTVTTETTNARRTLGYVFGGVGLVGVAGAAVTGIMLLDAHSTAEERCPNKECFRPDGTPDAEGNDAVQLGKTLLPINAVTWAVAAVGLGVGGFLLLTSGKKSTAAVAPAVTGTSAGLVAAGSF